MISLLLFLATSYALVPLWRRYRARYAQYLPLPLVDPSLAATPLRDRFRRALALSWLPSRFRPASADSESTARAHGLIPSAASDSDEGEELGDIDLGPWGVDRIDSVPDTPESRLSRE